MRVVVTITGARASANGFAAVDLFLVECVIVVSGTDGIAQVVGRSEEIRCHWPWQREMV